MELQVGEWSIDKRHYMGGGPPRDLHPPPACAHDRAHVLRALYNNASSTLSWGGGGSGQTDRFNHLAFRKEGGVRAAGPMAARLLGTGPWLLAGSDGGRSYRLEKMWILNHGFLLSSKGHGRWGEDAGGGYLTFATCGMKLRLKLVVSADGKWTSGVVVEESDIKAQAMSCIKSPAHGSICFLKNFACILGARRRKPIEGSQFPHSGPGGYGCHF